ncbi:unnamed protein product, partial [Didymodactylos carnosus]
STFPLFDPPTSQYQVYHVTRATSTTTLNELISIAKQTTSYVLDTESITQEGKRNQPALIQLQFLRLDQPSIILLVEVCHLPIAGSRKFSLIQELFTIILAADKAIHTWGDIEELNKFVKYQLFTPEQLLQPNTFNVQNEFKEDWRTNHPHRTIISPADEDECIWHTCIGKQPNDPWSLQDALEYGCRLWLDKRMTLSPWNIGLDPMLFHLNDKQREQRQAWILYAIKDCLAVALLMKAKANHPKPHLMQPSVRVPCEPPSEDESDIEAATPFTPILPINRFSTLTVDPLVSPPFSLSVPLQIQPQHPPSSQQEPHHIDQTISYEPISDDSTPSTSDKSPPPSQFTIIIPEEYPFLISASPPASSFENTQQPNSEPHLTSAVIQRLKPQLSELQKKRKNRQKTLKQRARKFATEIIRRNIYKLWSAKKIIEVLDRKGIPHSRVLTRVSPTTGTHHVFIGLQKPDDFERWDNLTSDWFTEAHYNKVYLPHRRTSTSRDRSNRPDHSAHQEAFDPRSRRTDRSFRSDHSHQPTPTKPGEGTRTVTGSHRQQYKYHHKSR